jgi:hypothetical protein
VAGSQHTYKRQTQARRGQPYRGPEDHRVENRMIAECNTLTKRRRMPTDTTHSPQYIHENQDGYQQQQDAPRKQPVPWLPVNERLQKLCRTWDSENRC